MSKAKLAAAKEFIQEHRYEEARTILKTVDHPTACQWLAELDARVPPPPPRQALPVYSPYLSGEQQQFYTRENRKARRRRIGNGIQCILGGLLCFAAYLFFSMPTQTIPGSPTDATSTEVMLIPVGMLAILAGLYMMTKPE